MATNPSDGLNELDEVVAQCTSGFDTWVSLISNVEQTYHDDVDKISLVYDSFLSEFPLCYGYWKKYAEHKARLSSVESAVEVFERAVEAVPYSVGAWVDYCSFGASSFEDPFEVCRLFDRGLSFVGKDYLCCNLWDKYIEFEFSQQHWNSLANIYIQTLKFPTKRLHQYYESFMKLVAIWEEESGCRGSSQTKLLLEHRRVGETTASEEAEISQVISDLLDPSIRSKALLKYKSIGEQVYRRACELEEKVQIFEQNIRRPYFHVKPLDDNQLQNWHRYLDLVEKEGDFDWAVKLYERCLISCANYPEFWMRYVDFVEPKGGKEMATDALDRATNIFLKNAPEIHLFNAWFREKLCDCDSVREAFRLCDQVSEFPLVEVVRRRANMERRLGNHVAAITIYKEALDLAAEKRPETIPLLYVHFARLQYMISKNVETTRDVLLNGIELVPHSILLIKELMFFALVHEGALQVGTMDSIMAKVLTPELDVSGGLSTNERVDLSRLYLEFIDFCGSIHDIRKAWNRHLKLFPHLVRRQTPLNNSAKAGALWDMVNERRLDSVDTDEKNLADNTDHAHQAIHDRAEVDDVNCSLNDSLVEDACRAKELDDTDVNQAAENRDPFETIKEPKSNGLQQEKEQKQEQKQDDESENVIKSPSRRIEPSPEASVSNGHDVDQVRSVSGALSPRDTNAAERYNESPGPRRERSHSPRRRSSHGNFSDRRYRERSLSPRRRYSEDRWHRDRRNRRYNRYQDNPRGRRDGRVQNQNHVVVVGNSMQMQTPNSQQNSMGFVSQTQPQVQHPQPFTQAQMNQFPLPTNEQYGNVQNSQFYNQMWQYYYYNQQQQLEQMQPQQQLQMQNPLQQQHLQAPQQQQQQINPQQQQMNPQQQQLLQLQYQQLYQQPQLQQQQANEQPLSQEQQMQLQQLYQQQQLQQQPVLSQPLPQPVLSQPQPQPQTQVQQQEELDVQKQQQQQQAYQYQQQQYLLYLQQLQQYQLSQQQAGLVKDQSLPQQPAKEEELESLQEISHRDEKSQAQPQQDGGSLLLAHPRSISYGQQGRGVQTSISEAAALAQSQDQLPELEGTEI